MKKIIFLSIMISLLILPAAIWAEGSGQCGAGREGSHGGWQCQEGTKAKQGMKNHLEEMKELLGLTDEQYEALLAQKEEHREAVKETRNQYSAKRKELMEEIHKETIDTGRITQIHSESKSLQLEIMDHRLEGMLKMREILTAEQFQLMQEKFRSGRKGRNGKKGKWNKEGPAEEQQ